MSNARDKANIPALNFSSTGIDDNATSTAITIDSSQRVGIGIASPTSPLMVQSNETYPIHVKGANPKAILLETTGGETSITTLQLKNSAYTWNVEGGRRANTFTFYANTGAERMCIDGSGNVGIGTSSPSSGLEVDNANGVIISRSGYSQYMQLQGANNFVPTILGLGGNGIQIGPTNTTGIKIDGSGNVGIGTSSPSNLLHIFSSSPQMIIQDGGIHGTNSSPGLVFKDASSSQGEIGFENSGEMFIRQLKNSDMTFRTNNSEAMRIQSSGKIYIGRTNDPYMSALSSKNLILDGGSNGADLCITSFKNGTTVMYHMGFYNSNSFVGSISTVGSGTAYNTASDYRLKENVNYDFDATTRLKQLKPARFNFIADADTTVDGFIAHEVQSVVPEAITGEKDAVDEKNNPVYQGIDQSKLVPLLVKTIKTCKI